MLAQELIIFLFILKLQVIEAVALLKDLNQRQAIFMTTIIMSINVMMNIPGINIRPFSTGIQL